MAAPVAADGATQPADNASRYDVITAPHDSVGLLVSHSCEIASRYAAVEAAPAFAGAADVAGNTGAALFSMSVYEGTPAPADTGADLLDRASKYDVMAPALDGRATFPLEIASR